MPQSWENSWVGERIEVPGEAGGGVRPAVLSTDGVSTEKLGTGSPGLSVHEGTAGAPGGWR